MTNKSRRTVILAPGGNPLQEIASQNATDANGVVTIAVDTLENPVTLDTLQLRDNSGTLEVSADEGSTWDTVGTGTIDTLESPVTLGTDIQLRDNSGVFEVSADEGSTWETVASGEIDTLANPVTIGDVQLRENDGAFEFSSDSGSTWEAVGTGTGTSDPTQQIVLTSTETSAFYEGMYANGTTDAYNSPLAFLVDTDDSFWRSAKEHNVDLKILYYDETTDTIQVQYNSDDGVVTQDITTGTASGTWQEATAEIRSVEPTVTASLYICSDTERSDDPIVDTSTSAHTLTNTGVYHTTSEYQFSKSSLRFYGTYLEAAAHDDFNLSSSAFTIMLWCKTSAGGWQNFFCNDGNDSNGWYVSLYNGTLYVGGVDGSQWNTGITSVNDGTWHHICVCSDGAGTLYAYLDGDSQQTKSYTSINYNSAKTVQIGADGGSYTLTGWLEDLYLYKGTCLHTETSFTVPSDMLKNTEGTGGQSGIIFDGQFSSYSDADLLLAPSTATALHVAHMTLTDTENNAYVIWRP